MPKASHPPLAGELLDKLVSRWQAQHRPSAEGGWWALAGFSFQTATFLLRLFRNLTDGGLEPGALAEMERLSDILAPQDGKLVLTQVKRTLDKAALISAVHEAYLITHLCRQETPDLLDLLRFQIACRRKRTPCQVADLSMSEVVKTDGDPVSWDAMLKLFDQTEPILEEQDPLDHLHLYLWNVGIEDATDLIERCQGHLLAFFGTHEPGTSAKVGRGLASLFHGARRRVPWEPFQQVLTPDEAAPDENTAAYKEVLTGQVPNLEHLRKGYFRERVEIFESLCTRFHHWLSEINGSGQAVREKIPLFWITGRSGEGKSILLLQLMAFFLRSAESRCLVHLRRGNELPRLLEKATRRYKSPDPIFAAIDDLYDLDDRETWDEDVRRACSLGAPAVAILTCGPTEQFEQFQRRLGDQFEVSFFDVPRLSLEECQAFAAWYERRTGQSRDLTELTTENPLLVQLMFEMAQGMSLRAFAVRFKRRLALLGSFESVRTVLAVNALYMDAPLSLLPTDQNRDALQRLCAEDQLHFRISPPAPGLMTGGVRLAHPHLAWRLFLEWADPSTTLSKAWARELAKVLAISEHEGSPLLAGNLLHQLLQTTRLSDDPEDAASTVVTAYRRSSVRELHQLHVAAHNGRPTQQTLPRWLDFAHKIPGLGLHPEPLESAVAELSSDRARTLHGSVAGWVWLLAESQPEDQARRMKESAKSFLFQYSNNPGVGSALVRILSHTYNHAEAQQLCVAWLTANVCSTQAIPILAKVVATSPEDNDVRKKAIDWLAANPDHQLAYQVIASLVAAKTDDPEVYRLASDWLSRSFQEPRAYCVIEALLGAKPADADVRKFASDWLAANRDRPIAYQVLAPLVAAGADDPEIHQLATNWLAANQDHQIAYQVIAPLVAARADDPEVNRLATRWLVANSNHPEAYWLLAPLLAASPNDPEIQQLAADWLDSNPAHPQYQVLLRVMIARTEGSDDWLRRGEQYVADASSSHPEMVVGVLLTRGKAASRFVELAFNFLARPLTKKSRNFVLYQLGRALVHNLANAAEYLNGRYDERRKAVVCTSIAIGMKRYQGTISKFASDGAHLINDRYLCYILSNAVARQVESEDLDRLIVDTLNNNYHRPGYGALLDALRADKDRWQSLKKGGSLSEAVVRDFG